MKRRTLILAAIVGLSPVSYAGPVDLSNGLLAHYAFNGTAQDATGNGNDGTIIGPLSWTTDRFGNANSALSLNRNGYVSINPSSLFLNGASSAAISGWVINQMNQGEGGFVVGVGDSRAGQDPFTIRFGGNRFAEAIFTDATKDPYAPDRNIGIEGGIGGPLSNSQWISFVSQFTAIGSTAVYQLYLNGALVLQNTYDHYHQIVYDQPMPFQIGALTGYSDTYFRGAIDDVRFYNRALSSDEIRAVSTVPDGGVMALLVGLPLIALMGIRRRLS